MLIRWVWGQNRHRSAERSRGIVPSPEWKLHNYRQKWYAGRDDFRFDRPGCDDGHALAVGPRDWWNRHGRSLAHTPPAALGHEDGKAARVGAQSRKCEEGCLRHVWRGERGRHGVRARIPGLDVCGKTGTAQVASAEYEKAHRDVKDNAWFVAYAPCYKPEIVVSVLWENWRPGRTRRAYRARHHRGLFRQEKPHRRSRSRQTDATVQSGQCDRFRAVARDLAKRPLGKRPTNPCFNSPASRISTGRCFSS